MSHTTRYVMRLLLLAAILGLALALAATASAQDGTPDIVYTTRSVFMRAGPSMGWRVLATLPGGEQLEVLGVENGWHNVKRADGSAGWVYGAYLTATPPGAGGGAGSALPGSPLVPRPAEVNTLAQVTTPLLNVRSGPGINFAIVGTVRGGETVAVLDRSAQWRFIVSAGGVRGWVNSVHLSSSITPPLNLGDLDLSGVGGGPAGAPLGGPLTIRSVAFDHAVRDPSRPGGAIATVRLEFTGGAPPFALTSDGQARGSGLTPATRQEGGATIGTLFFTEVTECGATMVHTVGLASADGQSASRAYYISPVICPN